MSVTRPYGIALRLVIYDITARHLRHYGSSITTSKHFNRIEGIEYELACLILPSLNKREKLSGNTKQGFGGVGIKKEKST